MTLAGVEFDVRRGVVVARVSGDVDASNADRVLADVSAAVANDATGVVLDLSGTRYLDSAGITVLFDLHGRLETRRQRLRIVAAADARLRRILELTGVAALVPLDDSAETAVDAIAGGSPAPAPGTPFVMTEQPGHPDLNPGDEAEPQQADAGGNLCPRCSGSGRLDDASECPECGGSGKIVEAVGGG